MSGKGIECPPQRLRNQESNVEFTDFTDLAEFEQDEVTHSLDAIGDAPVAETSRYLMEWGDSKEPFSFFNVSRQAANAG